MTKKEFYQSLYTVIDIDEEEYNSILIKKGVLELNLHPTTQAVKDGLVELGAGCWFFTNEIKKYFY